MIRKVVHNISTEEDNNDTIPIAEKVEDSTKHDDYDFLDNIDFLQHIDMSEYEKEIFSVESDVKKEDEISVNLDYLDDLAYFDELDYFEQLNKSLESELRELDTNIHNSNTVTKRRWLRKHSNAIMVTAGLGVLLVVGGVVISAVGLHLSKADVSYASTEHKPGEEGKQPGENGVLTSVTSTPKTTEQSNDQKDGIRFVKSEKADEEQTDNKKVSQQLISKREEIATSSQQSTEPAKTAAPTKQPEQTTPVADTGDLETFFSDSVFIGNSLTEGLQYAGGVKSAKYLAATSLNVVDVFTRQFVKTSSGMKTALEALEDIQCSKIYVMFGINEIGWPYPKVYEERYIKVINKIKQIKPNATIYIQSMLPVSKSLANTDKMYKSSNMKEFNDAMEDAAKQTGCIFVDVTKGVANSEGYLPEEAAVDGMHMKREYNKKWQAYLYERTK